MFKTESQELPSTGLNRHSEHLGLGALTSQNPVTAEKSGGGPLDRCVEVRMHFVSVRGSMWERCQSKVKYASATQSTGWTSSES